MSICGFATLSWLPADSRINECNRSVPAIIVLCSLCACFNPLNILCIIFHALVSLSNACLLGSIIIFRESEIDGEKRRRERGVE